MNLAKQIASDLIAAKELELLAELQHRYENSLFNFSREILGYKDITYRTHGKIIESLESDTTRKLIVAPRGSLKTSLCAIAYPAWRIIKDFNIRILIDSELFTNSKSHIREIRGHLESEDMKTIWGEFVTKKNWSEESFTIQQRTKLYKERSCIAGGVGTRKIGMHFDVWICDDMNSPQNTATPELAKKVVDHYKYGLSILEPEGTLVIIGTRYSELDLIQHILDNEVNEGAA